MAVTPFENIAVNVAVFVTSLHVPNIFVRGLHGMEPKTLFSDGRGGGQCRKTATFSDCTRAVGLAVTRLSENGRGYTLGLFFTNWRYSPCYWSGLKKEKRRGEKKFKNFYFKIL